MRRIDLIALAIGAALLAFGPLALTLARADAYHATAIVAFDTADPAARYLKDPRDVLAGPLTNSGVQRTLAADVDWFNHPKDLPKYVTVEAQGDGKFGVTASGPDPQAAADLAEAAGHRLREAAVVAANFTRESILSVTKGALRRGGQSSDKRAALVTRRDALETSKRQGGALFLASDVPVAVPHERIGDRVLNKLPGKRSFRPDPIWVAIAGIALASALVLWAMALGPMRSRSGSTSG